MFRIITLIFLFGACAFRTEDIQNHALSANYDSDGDGVEDFYEGFFGFDYRVNDISPDESKFIKRVVAESGFDASIIEHVNFSNAESKVIGEKYFLGEVSSKDQLHLLLTPKLHWKTKIKNQKKKNNEGCSIEFFIPYEVEETLVLDQNFEGVLKDVELQIGDDEYSLKGLYEEKIIEDSWFNVSGDKDNLQIIIKDFSEIKEFEQEDVYLKLYSNSIFHQVDGYNPFLPHFNKINNCAKFWIDSALEERVGFGNDFAVFFYLYEQTLPKNLSAEFSTLLLKQTGHKKFYQNYSFGVHAIITKPKEVN